LLEPHVDRPQLATDRLKTTMERWRVSLFGDRLHVILPPGNQAEQDLHDTLTREGIRLISQRESRFSLEDVFISVVERARLEGKVAQEE
jgi:ABC-2 type transport system ATP-binding protein